ncbi:hypothetical protein H5410_036998 [Solanum commersonii]|uniref:Uncharacterized protein n=1 Tax=Solanum commersonii TaxID=4109 RepID=A0A9J5Y9W7_SOLCO|nr:hypothetical protein H5410_036998 [Solanum commersonii]
MGGDSSVRRGPIFCRIKHPFESHNGFEVAAELIDEFNKWVFKDKFEPQMNFGVVKVSEINFLNIMVKTGRPWKDGHHVDIIMYYLRKKAKYSLLSLSYMIEICTHVYLLNTSAMEFLICVLLISMQSTIVKGMPQSHSIMEKQRIMMARSVRVK